MGPNHQGGRVLRTDRGLRHESGQAGRVQQAGRHTVDFLEFAREMRELFEAEIVCDFLDPDARFEAGMGFAQTDC